LPGDASRRKDSSLWSPFFNLNALITSYAFILIRLPDKISRHQLVSRYLSPSYITNIPARTTATITVALYITLGIVDKVNKPGFFTQCDDIKSFFLCDFSRKP
jgi:hypothetical protein